MADDAASHIPIMVAEVLRHLRPRPGASLVDATIGGGGHARVLLPRLRPGGRLIGLDVDPIELPRTEARLRVEGFGPEELVAVRASFAHLPAVLARLGIERIDGLLLDLGISAMQHDVPERGFSYKLPGPLDLRMDPSCGRPAWQMIAELDADAIADVLTTNADEPHAARIATIIAGSTPRTTHDLERRIRQHLSAEIPDLPGAAVKRSIRRTFQALRILVNDEYAALDAVLRDAPSVLAPDARMVVLTFHSGEDRRVKKAFARGLRDGTWRATAPVVVRSGKAETFANRRAASAKLRWAIRGPARPAP